MSRTIARSTASLKTGRKISIEAPGSNMTSTGASGTAVSKDRAGWGADHGAGTRNDPGTIIPGTGDASLPSRIDATNEDYGNISNNNSVGILTSVSNTNSNNKTGNIYVSTRKETVSGKVGKGGSTRTNGSSPSDTNSMKGRCGNNLELEPEKPPGVPAIKRNLDRVGLDNINNNKVAASPTSDACIVDNLVMDSDRAQRKQHPASSDKPQTTTSTTDSTSVSDKSTRFGLGTPVAAAPEVAFSDPRQSQVFQILTGVQHLRKDTDFTDITVKVQDAEFRCHRFVLAINSPFLHALVKDYAGAEGGDGFQPNEPTCNNSVTEDAGTTKGHRDLPEGETRKVAMWDGCDRGETSDTISESDNVDRKPRESQACQETKPQLDSSNAPDAQGCIRIKGIQPEIFSKMLDFMYCQFEDVLTESNCLELLLAADTVQLPHLRRTCAAFVTDTLSPSNVFQVMALCDAGYSGLFEPRITKRAHQVIRENFAQLSSLDEFQNVGRHVMIPLLADSMLHIRSEMEVLQALLRWVNARPEERCSDMTLMLQHVRFPLMSSRELEKLREVPVLKQNSLAMALLEESRAYGNLDYNERMAWPRHNSISRCLFSTRDLILWTADRDKGLHFYSIIDGQHHKVTSFGELTAPPPPPLHANQGSTASTTPTSTTPTGGAAGGAGNFSFDSTSSVCCYGDKIFFTGGEFNTDMAWSVDTSTGEVKVHAKMPRGRKFHSMMASKGCVYCLGGQDKRGYTVLEDVDAYIINKDMWVKVGHLAVPAYNMSAAVSGGAIYLVGGLDHAGQPLRLIQCFIALRSGLYSAFKVEITNMPPSLLSARAVACGLDKAIYIVCGHGEVYKFEPERQSLSHVTTLRNLSDNPRVRFGLAYMGGCLVVIGGHQLGHVMHEPIRSVCLDIASKTEVRDYSPLLPGDIVNTCLAAKLSSNILRLFTE